MKSMDFQGLFPTPKPIIGMIHLAGNGRNEKIRTALEELIIYQEEGVDGAIIEDYHGDFDDVIEALRQSNSMALRIIRGINILKLPYVAFPLAGKLGARFIQFDSVQTPDLKLKIYRGLRRKYPDIVVLGGVGFKYTQPTGNPLEVDLREAKSRCEAIVTTGSGTGIETPTDKLIEYRRLLGDFPLIVGAGVNQNNVYEQLKICDGAIVGSYFKLNGNTELAVDRMRVRSLMQVVKSLRG